MTKNKEDSRVLHSEEIEEIITAVPPILISSGATITLFIFLVFVGLSALIKYPDAVSTTLTISSSNHAKPITAKINGRISEILVSDRRIVHKGEILAFMESTADHKAILNLLGDLKKTQDAVAAGHEAAFAKEKYRDLGELQPQYEIFVANYLKYAAAINKGFIEQKRNRLIYDIELITQNKSKLELLRATQLKDLALSEEELKVHKRLEQEKVETRAEIRAQESKYLSKREPLLSTESILIGEQTKLSDKRKEILDLNNQAMIQKAEFIQGLNSFISEIENWKTEYVLSATETGRLSYNGSIQENQLATTNQVVFFVIPDNQDYIGEIALPQINLGKVKVGQKVLIKLQSYPYQQYGIIKGKIIYIADVTSAKEGFNSKVLLDSSSFWNKNNKIILKEGMIGEAEIVTQDATILQRLTRSLAKLFQRN